MAVPTPLTEEQLRKIEEEVLAALEREKVAHFVTVPDPVYVLIDKPTVQSVIVHALKDWRDILPWWARPFAHWFYIPYLRIVLLIEDKEAGTETIEYPEKCRYVKVDVVAKSGKELGLEKGNYKGRWELYIYLFNRLAPWASIYRKVDEREVTVVVTEKIPIPTVPVTPPAVKPVYVPLKHIAIGAGLLALGIGIGYLLTRKR